MRYTAMLVVLFALEGSAFNVGRHAAARDGGTSSPPSSSTLASTATMDTTKTDSATTTQSLSPSQETDKSELCNDAFNYENWQKYEMDYWLDYWSSTYPETVSGSSVPDDTDWIDFLAKQTGSISNIHCEAGSTQCHLGDLSNTDACEKDPYWTPLFFFALSACLNLFDWASGVNNILESQSDDFQTQVMGIVTDFTDHDTSGDPATGILTMMGGLLGAVSGLLGPLGALASGAAGAASGIVAFANGAQISMQANYAQLLQNELDTYSSVEELVGQSIVLMQNATMMIVESAINVVPDNSGSDTGNYWYAHPSSAPYLMKNGTFAEEMPNVDYNILSGDLSRFVNSSAVAVAWIQQNVFVARRTDNVHDTAPCDIDLDKLDGARVCDGDTAYFFMVSQSINTWGDYVGVPGTSKVDDYGLDLLTMAQSAEWISDHHNGYLPQVSPTDIVKDFTYDEGALENGYFINLPFMDANDLDEPSFYFGGGDLPDEGELIMEVLMHIVNDIDDWPY